MAESFNAWILGLRNNTIVTILEEIRVKVMSRVSKLRAFADTWTNGISPMAMMVFNTNVTRTMRYNIEWNGDDGFEVLEGVYTYTMNLGQQKCSCRSWKLKYIPCAHGITSMNHLNMDASQAISSCRNPIVEPPEARQMPGRTPKNRRRELDEVRKAGKLPRMGIIMTCSICRGANHNKRNCPKNPKPKSTPTPTQESITGKKKGRGQYERTSNNWYKKRCMKWLQEEAKSCGTSSRRVNTGVVSSAHVTGDIDFKPTKGLKWKGKQAMTQRELQVQSVMHRIQTRSKAVGIQTRAQAKEKSPSKKTS
ncbi:hypothetical protein H5410_032206 [Solanum commersonii]|uniref:SWIM-type domain-containing protein n=1 Tax=Solanum commersonii TaxID=4109 RepID=A0A9J5YP01_SOLCO|nr:hypothetical protein H5410_032206 [Solanum commersonii]